MTLLFAVPNLIGVIFASGFFYIVMSKAGFGNGLLIFAFAPLFAFLMNAGLSFLTLNVGFGDMTLLIITNFISILVTMLPLIVLALVDWPNKTTLTSQDGI